jgi:hypothetical protein
MNIEGLKRHSFMRAFVPEPKVPLEERRLRIWLLHTLATAARQYTKARELVLLQEQADQANDGGAIFYLLDVSEQLEGCVMALHRVFTALKRMYSSNTPQHIQDLGKTFDKLSSLRNQFEHMHTQIVSKETGKGPISITFANEGASVRFRDKWIDTTELKSLLQAAFIEVSSLFPLFDANSAPELGGPIKLSITGTIEVIEGKQEAINVSNPAGDA